MLFDTDFTKCLVHIFITYFDFTKFLSFFRNHWDHQLYKALEHQYQVGLEALNEYLPEIEVFITYRQQKLQFQPPIEEIRMKYYSQLKRFLAIPKNFRGVSESSENLIFPSIIERNAHRFSHLFSKAEELFIQLVFLKHLCKYIFSFLFTFIIYFLIGKETRQFPGLGSHWFG